jgi:hypothetical protein
VEHAQLHQERTADLDSKVVQREMFEVAKSGTRIMGCCVVLFTSACYSISSSR